MIEIDAIDETSSGPPPSTVLPRRVGTNESNGKCREPRQYWGVNVADQYMVRSIAVRRPIFQVNGDRGASVCATAWASITNPLQVAHL